MFSIHFDVVLRNSCTQQYATYKILLYMTVSCVLYSFTQELSCIMCPTGGCVCVYQAGGVIR